MLLLLLAISSALALPGEPFDTSRMRVDLVTNGGMEVGNTAGVLGNWVAEGPVGSAFLRTDARAFAGVRSARLQVSSASASTSVSGLALEVSPALVAGESYVLSALVDARLANPAAVVFVDLSDQSWAQLSGTFGDCETRGNPSGGRWELLECRFRATRNPPVARVRVGVRGPLLPGDEVYFDHVALTHIGRYYPPVDPSFDHDGDGVTQNQGDCDESNPSIRPNVPEIWYDGVDQNCDGADDYDRDGDGFRPLAQGGADCDDTNASVNPSAGENWYDGVDQNCDGNDKDRDGDGHDHDQFGGDDCDDLDPAVSPSTAEVWYDGADQDCDGADDFDADGDGHAAASEASAYTGPLPADDCDDQDPETFPGAEELPGDGVDQDCDGADAGGAPVRPFDDTSGANATPEGCGCASGGSSAGAWLLALGALAAGRSRRLRS